jgi:hypothetical protein
MADQQQSSIITFSRRRRELKGDLAGQADSLCTSSLASSYVTAPSVLTPVMESPLAAVENVLSTADSGAGSGKAQLRRRLAPSLGRARAASHAQHVAELKAYFDEVRTSLVLA